jgi:uncharacterized membrane protein YbhN (UPF0104 family)
MANRAKQILGHLFGLVLFCGAVWVLYRTLRGYNLHDVIHHLRSIPSRQIVLALVVTVVSYLVLTLYDTMALRHLEIRLSYPRIALGSYIGYVFSHNATLFGGVAARYRVYSNWGITALQTAEVVAFCGITFWLGLFGIGGILFLIEPLPLPHWFRLPFLSARPLGFIFVLIVVLYLLASYLRKDPIRIFKKWHLTIPSLGFCLAQIALSVLDWSLAAGVLYVLLDPAAGVPFPKVLAVFLLAQSAGMVSHVPGGLGVLETVVLLFLAPPLSVPSAVGSLLLFRAIYFLLPLGVAVLLLGTWELLYRKDEFKRLRRVFGRWGS